jgi:hypothetical protein
MDFTYYTTDELKKHINNVYSKLKELAETDEVYMQLNVEFANEMPHGMEGIYCYADTDGYHYRYVERGTVQKHEITQDLFEITYLVIESCVFSMAVKYERKHRINNQDSRRIIFKKELQLFDVIGEDYRKKAEVEIKDVLREHPFQDELFK